MEIIAQKRDVLGKKVRFLRRKGLIPAELYGKGLENFHLAISAKDLKNALKVGENAVINVLVDSEKRPALIYDVHRDPIGDEILSVDLYQVRMDELLRTKVPVEFVGESLAVKSGGVLVKAVKEVEVEALPGNIPASLTVDLARLTEIGHSFQVKDWSLADLSKKGVKILLKPDLVVATVKEPQSEEKEQELAAAAPKLESVKVEGEEKKAEREAKKSEEKAS